MNLNQTFLNELSQSSVVNLIQEIPY